MRLGSGVTSIIPCVVVHTGGHSVRLGEHGDQAGQGRVAIAEQLADVLADLGALRLGRYALETKGRLDQLPGKRVANLVLDPSEFILFHRRLPHAWPDAAG